MKIFNWANILEEEFKKPLTCEDILNKIRKIERTYWIWLVVSLAIMLMGLVFIIGAPAGSLKVHSIGVFLAIDGCISIAVMKIWAHVVWAMYRILWNQNKKTEAELRKSEAEDL